MEQTLPLLDMTLGRMLDTTVARYPDNDAIVYVDRNFRLTYRQFQQAVDDWPGA